MRSRLQPARVLVTTALCLCPCLLTPLSCSEGKPRPPGPQSLRGTLLSCNLRGPWVSALQGPGLILVPVSLCTWGTCLKVPRPFTHCTTHRALCTEAFLVVECRSGTVTGPAENHLKKPILYARGIISVTGRGTMFGWETSSCLSAAPPSSYVPLSEAPELQVAPLGTRRVNVPITGWGDEMRKIRVKAHYKKLSTVYV